MKEMTSDRRRHDEKLYSTLVNTIHGIVWEADPLTFRFFFVSPHAERILGYPAKQWLEEPRFWFEHTHPDDIERTAAYCRDATAKGEDHEFQYRMIAADGRIVWLHDIVTVVRTEEGGLRLRGIMFDITARKDSEDALRASEERLRIIFDTSHAGILIIAPDGHISFANNSMAEMLGCPLSSLIGSPYLAHLHPDEQRPGASLIEQLMNREADHAASERHYLRCDGSDFWGYVTNARLKSEDGQVSGVIAVVSDITERRRIEDEIRRDKALLRCVIDSVGDLIFVKDVNGVYQACNRAAEEFIGIPESEQIGKTDFDFFDRDVAEAIRETDRRILASGRECHAEEWVTYRDGRRGLVDTLKAPFYGPDGKQLGLVGIARDITERQRTEELVRQERESCLDLINNQPAGIYRIRVSPGGSRRREARNDRKHSSYSVELVSNRFLEILGINSEDLETDPGIIIGLVHGEDRAEFARWYAEANSRLIPFLWEGRLNIGGKILWGHFESLPRPVANGDVLWTGILYDITAQKQEEAERERLEAQNRQLQKSESLGRMAAAIAHYFNNQLGAVIGNLEMAAFELPQGSRPAGMLTAATQAAEKAADMSRLMLTYLGQTFGEPVPLELTGTCRQALANLRTALPANVELVTAFPSPGPVISANAGKIQQVLGNLVTNAWEAMGENGGTIHLGITTVSTVDVPAAHRFPIDWRPGDHVYACLEVKDTGSGIAARDIEKLFDPFFSSKFTGRGLGLPVVLGIVKAHGGGVTVESSPGGGSTFRVFLPECAEEVRRQPEAPQSLPGEGGGVLLLVEDDPMVRDIAAVMIRYIGFSVIEAKNGVGAVELFRQRRSEIRCVICDLTMPGPSGWETLTAMRTLAPDIPVVMTSGYDEAQVMAGDHPELPQAFLRKPYKHKELSEAISRALAGRLP